MWKSKRHNGQLGCNLQLANIGQPHTLFNNSRNNNPPKKDY